MTERRWRGFSLLLGVILALMVGVPAASAQEELDGGGGGDNTAVAVNTRDGSSVFRISFNILRSSSDTIDNTNAAIAFASCEGCETVAIAWQVVLVSSDPSTVSPENYAIAINFECSDCATLASAYQWALGTDGNVHFTAEGNQAIAEIRQALQELRRSGLSIVEIQAELDLLAEDLERVLAEELVEAGPPNTVAEQVSEGDTAGDDGTSDDPGVATPTPTAPLDETDPPDDEMTPSPTPTPEDEVSPTPRDEVSPTMQATPTSSPTPSP